MTTAPARTDARYVIVIAPFGATVTYFVTVAAAPILYVYCTCCVWQRLRWMPSSTEIGAVCVHPPSVLPAVGVVQVCTLVLAAKLCVTVACGEPPDQHHRALSVPAPG